MKSFYTKKETKRFKRVELPRTQNGLYNCKVLSKIW